MQEAAGALRSLAFLTGVDGPAFDVLVSAAFPRRLARGQVLFTEDEVSDAVFVIVEGRIKVLVSSPRGDELVVSVLGPGELLGELSVLDGSHRSASAVALDEVALWCIPADALLTLLRGSAPAAMALNAELAGRLRRLTIATADLVFLDLPRRLAKFLVAGPGGTGVDQLAQAEVAAQLGVTRQTLNRALRRLQDRGWIEVHRSAVEVVDAAALERFASS